MGFESARAARRRLAVMAMSNERVLEALAPSSFPGPLQEARPPMPETEPQPALSHDLAHHLEELAHDIVATPGAGGALLVAFAAQSRALALVVEASLRTEGQASLPAEVMMAVQAALRVPPSMKEIGLTI